MSQPYIENFVLGLRVFAVYHKYQWDVVFDGWVLQDISVQGVMFSILASTTM
jgi:hypothetical protein